MLNLSKLFEKYADELAEFDKVKNKLSKRPDIHAFLLLDKIVPNEGYDIVSGAAHDEIWLDTDIEELAKLATKDQIIELIRCGVMLHETEEYLSMIK